MSIKIKCKTGFSLLEIVVILAVLLVLFLLTYPISRRAMVAVENTRCQTKLRRLGQAMQFYIAEMDGQIISRRGGSNRGPDMWGAELSGRGYLDEPTRTDGYRSTNGVDPDNLRCPVGKLPEDYSMTNYAWYTYGLNMFTGGKAQTLNGTQVYVTPVAAIENPSQFVLLSDSADINFNQTFRMRPSEMGGLAIRHGGKGNILFLDNHLEAVDGKEAEPFGFPAIYEE